METGVANTEEFLTIHDRSLIRASDGGLVVSTGHHIETDVVHDEYELIFIKGGALAIVEGSNRLQLSQNQTHLIWPRTVHTILSPESGEVSFYWVLFDVRPAPAPMAGDHIRIPKSASLTQPKRLLELLRQFLGDRQSGRLSAMMGSHLVGLVLCEIHRDVNSASRSSGRVDGSVDSVHVHIARRFREPISTGTIVKELNYNADYLERIFHKATGMSITDAIHRERIKEARRLLIHGYRNISEVAYACGFSGSDYFVGSSSATLTSLRPNTASCIAKSI